MSYSKIQAALETRVQSLVNVPTVAYENVKFVPTTGVPYIQTRFIPIDRRMVSLGVGTDNKPYFQKYEGVFQLLLSYPESQGIKPTNDMVNEICDKFEAATDLNFQDVYLTIKQVERMRGLNESPWFKTPVNIHWYSYSK